MPEPDLASSRRARVIRFLTIAGAAIAVINAGWILAYALANMWRGVAVYTVILLFAAGIVALARQGRVRLSAHLLCLLAIGAAWSIVLLYEPHHQTFGRISHLWFVPILIAVHFLFADASGWIRVFYAVLCIGSFAVVALGSALLPALDPVSATFELWARPTVIIGALATMVVLLQLFVADIVDAETRLERANARIEDLLENMLPRSVAQRLRVEGRTFADGYAHCSILFADIVGFTTLSEQIPPEAVVARLNAIFSRFDEIAEDLGLEKIKTIGDAYMIAAGIPEPRSDHAAALADFAISALSAAQEFDGIHLRIGINSGAVVAGVIGRKRFLYDLWGDAVNVAERMEAYGVADRVQVTRATYDLLQADFNFESRGNIAVRGHHDVEAYLLLGRKVTSAQSAGQ